MVLRKLLTALFCLLPSKLANLFLIILGHKVSWQSRIGFSFLYVDKIILEGRSRVGHFNFIKVNVLQLSPKSAIRNFNVFKGPISVLLEENAVIGKMNKFTRGYKPITYGVSVLHLGESTRVTYDNFFDLTCSITFGANSQVAGKGTQFWTHGYMHANEGIERIRVDGEIVIGDNVYIGTRCVFNPGVKVANAINLGGNSVISKDLIEPGMYVNQPLRYIKTDIEKTKLKLTRVTEKHLIEEVYTKEK